MHSQIKLPIRFLTNILYLVIVAGLLILALIPSVLFSLYYNLTTLYLAAVNPVLLARLEYKMRRGNSSCRMSTGEHQT